MNIDVTTMENLAASDLLAWHALQRANADCDSPFLHYQFARCLSRARDDVHVAALRDQDDILGYFPFQRDPRGIGCALATPLADHQGYIGRADLSLDARQLLRGCNLKALHFDHLLASQAMFQPFHSRLDDSPFVDLTDGYAAYRQRLEQSGSSLFSQIDRKARKVQRELGPLRLEWHDNSATIVDTLVQWKRQQLAAAGYQDLYALPWVRELIQQVLSEEVPGFAGRMSTLLAGDKLLSIHLGIQGDHVLASWIPTYNPDFAAHSPGLLLHDQLFRRAPQEGVRRVELGRGSNQLKRRFMSGANQVAMGALDQRLLHRMVRGTWYRTRDFVYATPLRHGPLRVYRRMRNQLTGLAAAFRSAQHAAPPTANLLPTTTPIRLANAQELEV